MNKSLMTIMAVLVSIASVVVIAGSVYLWRRDQAAQQAKDLAEARSIIGKELERQACGSVGCPKR